MASYKNIAPGLFIIADNSFGDYNRQVVHVLLKHVQDLFVEWLGPDGYGTKPVLIEYQDECPQIFGYDPQKHTIKLFVDQNAEPCQWVYQFAHEYCHHLINVKLDGDLSGLKWFEETICNLSSQIHLRKLLDDYNVLHPNIPSRDQILRWIRANSGTPQGDVRGYIQTNLALLCTQCYRREIYRDIATSVLPMFVSNPRLWKMILHFGDTTRWNSLENLFDYLKLSADESYYNSLLELRKMLIG